MAQAALPSRFAGQVMTNLVANLVQGILGIALIPFATRILGPEDYGIYGMAVVVAGLVVALCETGAAYVLYGHFADVREGERRELFSSLLALSAAAGTVAATLLWALWPLLGRLDSTLAALSPQEKTLLCLAVPCRTMWSIASPILIAQMRSNWLAACILLQAITVFTVVLMSLFIFEQERAALFWGNLAGAAAALALALFAIGRSAWATPRLHWLRKVVRLAPGAWLAGIAENLRSTVESATVVRATGSTGLGNYNHARLYYGLLMQGTNAFANVLWPHALQDAIDQSSQFIRVRLGWNLVYLCLTLAGLTFVFFGELIVALLTNGKFNQAAAWIPFFVIYLLIQNAGKPATAVLYAANRGNTLSALRVVTTSVAIGALLILVPQLGVPAALAIGIAEMVLTRVLVQLAARRIQPIPFQDQWVLLGCVVISSAWWLTHSLVMVGAERLGLFAVACTVLLILAGRSFSTHSQVDAFGHLRGLFLRK